MASDGWYPPAIDNHAPNDGGDHTGPVTVGVLHTTESTRFVPNRSNYFGHSSYPHFTCAVVNGVFSVWQHISLRRAGRALKNRSGGVQTNREGVIQIEVVGTAVRPFTNDPAMVKGLTELMRWIESETDIEAQSSVDWIAYPRSYGEKATQRLSAAEWTSYVGWLGHQHVAENDHGDPGAINIDALMQVPATPPDSTPKENSNMFLAVLDGKTYIIMGNTRKWVRTMPALRAYLKNGVPEFRDLPAAEVASFKDVTDQ